MYLKPLDALEQTTLAVQDAVSRIGEPYFQWLAWPQTWPHSGCGRRLPKGTCTLQAFHDAQTVVASGQGSTVLVYHCGEFAYEVKSPSEEFWVACGQRRLPGADSWSSVKEKFDNE